MIDVVSKKCVICKKINPSFNIEGEYARYCKNCKTDEMIDVNHIKCIECKLIRPSFNIDGLTAKYCENCKTEEMVNVVNNFCIKCKKINSSFNFKGLKAEYCLKCKTDDMINVKKLRCINEDCKNIAYYNIYGEIPKYCINHKTDKMIFDPIRRCIQLACNNLAIYGSSCPEYCKIHKIENKQLILIKNPCKQCNLYLITNNDILCRKCENPNKKVKIYEIEIKSLLDENKLVYSSYNQCIGTFLYRPDFVFRFTNFLIILEVDENQHKRYKTDNDRMKIISKSINENILFIRYNPNKYKSKLNLSNDKRQEILIKQLLYYSKNYHLIKEKLTVLYLFFDDFDEENVKLITIE